MAALLPACACTANWTWHGLARGGEQRQISSSEYLTCVGVEQVIACHARLPRHARWDDHQICAVQCAAQLLRTRVRCHLRSSKHMAMRTLTIASSLIMSAAGIRQ